MILFRRALIASALALSLGVPAALAQAPNAAPAPQAQPGPAYGPGMMWGGGYGPGMMGGGAYGSGMMWGRGGYGPGMMQGWRGGQGFDAKAADAFVDRQLAFEKAGLKITAQQAPLWDKYAEAVRANAKTMVTQHALLLKRDGSQDSVVDRLQIREQVMAVQLDSMRKSLVALRPLYAALDGDQKAQADSFMGFGMGRGPGMF